MTKATNPTLFLSQSEVADLLRCTVRTLQRYRAAGTGPAWRRLSARRVVYPRALFDVWVRGEK
jgi:DNA-binding transcriptional MerR regulator